MKFKAAISYYKTQTALAKALRVTQPCVSNWKRRGDIPDGQQLRLQAITNGALKADRSITR